MSEHNQYVLVHFKKDNTYSIIDDKVLKLVNQKKANVQFSDGWYTGKIIYRGSKKKCEKKSENIGDEKQLSSDSEYEAYKSKKNRNKKGVDDADNETESEEIASSQNQTEQQSVISSQTVAPRQPLSSTNSNITALYHDIAEIKFEIFEQKQTLKLIMECLAKNKKSNDEYPTSIMFNGKNLLDSACTTMSRYITFLMRHLYTVEERMNGVIKIPGEPCHSRRKTLSPNRAEIFKNCVLAKARPSEDQKQKLWFDCVDKANRRCYDTKPDEDKTTK